MTIQKRIFSFFEKVFWMLCSLKLAVLVILALAIAMGVATFIESLYDTPTAQYWVYRSTWFYGIMIALGLNIFCVAISRYPWKARHIPFLLAHLGILILLMGSWITDRIGIDGNLRISEGETASVVELDQPAFIIADHNQVFSLPIRWQPSEVGFKSIDVASRGLPYDLRIDQYLTHADPIVSFIPNPSEEHGVHEDKAPSAAVKLKLVGGPMGTQEVWLWEGASGWQSLQAGPAFFSLGGDKKAQPGQPALVLTPEKDGSLSYWAQTSQGKVAQGRFKRNQIQGQKIAPGWKGNLSAQIAEWIPNAVASTTYKPARIQHGPQAPTSAIHVVASETVDVWLGLGDRAVLHVADRDIDIGYYPKRVVLPFSIRLDRFTIEHDQGTWNPAAYSSRVTVLDEATPKEVTISMNEPLEARGYTVYQASYEEGDPRPVTSIFSINRDPGRFWKYLGSALIVLGSTLLFAAKYKKSKTAKKASAKAGLGLPTPTEA